MAVITVDTTVEGMKRNDVLEWLGVPDNHDRILQGAFDAVERSGDSQWKLTLSTFPKKRELEYTFDRVDTSHAGRRVLCQVGGKRTRGKLHYSLRTPRASRNTLVTLHYDYDPGAALGALLDQAGLRTALDQAWNKVLTNLLREIYADHS